MNMGKAFDANDMLPKKRLLVAEERGKTATLILVHPILSDSDIPDVVKTV